jgi:hypothetical protein
MIGVVRVERYRQIRSIGGIAQVASLAVAHPQKLPCNASDCCA